MPGSRYSKQVTRNAYMLLAALLLADGEWVSRKDLARSLFLSAVPESALSRHRTNLERFGIFEIDCWYSRGYRLRALPPDEHLDHLLAVVPQVKRSHWWRLRQRVEQSA